MQITTASLTRGMSQVAGVTMASIMAFAAPNGHSAQWKPEKNVEIIVAAGPGGGQDKTARLLQRILQAKQMVSSSSVVNKPGGAGTIAWTYLNQHAGDGHYLAIAAPSLLTNHITGTSSLHYLDVTPLAIMGSEYVVVALKADSPLKTVKDLADRLKKDPGSLSVSVGSRLGDANHITISLVGKAAGADVKKLKTVVFKSGSEAFTAVLGGHVDLMATAANNVVPHMTTGKLRVLAVSSPQRLSGVLADVPTLREQGVDAVVGLWRTVIGPRGIAKSQIAYWDEAFAGVVRTDEWKAALEASLMENTYMTSEETKKYLAVQYEGLKQVLTELGLAK